ncbi:MAG: sigma-70 family RNA polymerase sigma factor [Planctomycetes bacterium]|nr:sigma-70 family RNA polymerase sigma factor [Planctomycetota bacterium]
MDKVSKADIFLVEQIRAGKDEAWSQLIDRYQGRLLTFARARLPQHADSEDIVQETFIAFLKGVHSFRHECNLETFLFAMLRRKIIDNYRRRSARNFCLIQDVYDSSPEERGSDAMDGFVAPDPSVSWYVRKDEQADIQRQALAEALTALVSHYKKSLSFLELKIVESIFYSHLTNSDTAKLLGLSANRIGVIKHRCLKQIRQHISDAQLSLDPESTEFENLLTEVWQSQRLSCPKRSTIGASLLGTLDEQWSEYVDFHLNTLGCHTCRANLDDLKRQNEESDHPRALHSRFMESTVGFLNKP